MAVKNGGTLTVDVSWMLRVDHETFYFDLYGTQGSATFSPLKVNKELYGNLVNVAPARIESPQVLYRKSYENELKHFIGAAKGLHPVISTGNKAVQRMRIIDAVYKSAARGKEIVLQ